MNIISVTTENFCSYKYLSFDFTEKGLCLISGDTGVGKSTLLDAVAWGLFGITSKDGSADDIRAWDVDGPTEVQTVVETPTGTLWVFRTRGMKNDLFWLEDGTGPEMRGKDLSDTQQLLEQRLGVTADLFLIGAYLTQFSKADSFFVAKAKDRRQVLEKIADQEFAIKLGERTSDARKIAKKAAERLEVELSGISGKLEVTKDTVQDAMISETQWIFENTKKIQALEAKQASFEYEWQHNNAIRKAKASEWRACWYKKVEALGETVDDDTYDETIASTRALIVQLHGTVCSECGAQKEHDALHEAEMRLAKCYRDQAANKAKRRLLDQLDEQENPYSAELPRQNPYDEQLEALKAEINPHTKRLHDAQQALQSLSERWYALGASLTETNALVASLTWLYDKSFEMRSLLMARVVSQIETATNALLEKHFDAAIRVQFLLQDSDKLEVEVLNDGHRGGFKSLSGGERTLLKLCFSLSLMKAAQDKAGTHFDQIFLDEPLAGLDSGLKVKAFGLFQQLESEHSAVLVIEHDAEFKAQFSNTYAVSKGSDGHSEIHES